GGGGGALGEEAQAGGPGGGGDKGQGAVQGGGGPPGLPYWHASGIDAGLNVQVQCRIVCPAAVGLRVHAARSDVEQREAAVSIGNRADRHIDRLGNDDHTDLAARHLNGARDGGAALLTKRQR